VSVSGLPSWLGLLVLLPASATTWLGIRVFSSCAARRDTRPLRVVRGASQLCVALMTALAIGIAVVGLIVGAE
jgi:hypothetical protein